MDNNHTIINIPEASCQNREKMEPLVYVASQQKILSTGVLDVGDANLWRREPADQVSNKNMGSWRRETNNWNVLKRIY